MRLWVDDIRPTPPGYQRACSVNEARRLIEEAEEKGNPVELIDLDHDAGDFAGDGGDYICLLDWLVERGTFYPVRFHTANPVGRGYMERLVERYWP